jgi:acyl dehydratase
MATAAETAHEKFQARIGQPDGEGEWFEMTQERINDFADVTIDHQFIHVDPEAAKASPFGTTIAHGFLTLSMLTHLAGSIRNDPETVKGVIMGVNYGFDKVRFVSPVPSGSRVRASSVLKAAEDRPARRGRRLDHPVDVRLTVTRRHRRRTRPGHRTRWRRPR